MKDSGIDIVGFIPENWVTARLKYLSNIKTGSQDTQDAVEEGLYPFYVRSPIVEKIDKYVFDGEAILMAGDGVGAGKVFHYVNGKFGCHQRVYILNSFKRIAGRFLFYYLKNLFSIEIEKGSAKSTVDSVRLPMLQNFMICIPFLQEQKKISDFLDGKCIEIDALSSDIQLQISILENYKKSVITEAVTKGLNPDVKMKDSGIKWIGEIPFDWEITRFKYIGIVKSNLVNTGLYRNYPQISPDNIAKDSGILLSYNTVEESGVISDNHLFYKGQILYSKIRPKLNKVIIAPFNGLCSADMYPIETNECSKFILYMILSQYFLKQVALVTEDRVKMPKINQEELGRIYVVLPKRENQEKIVEYLDKKCAEIDVIITKKREQLDVLEQYKKSLIYEYITGKKEVLADD